MLMPRLMLRLMLSGAVATAVVAVAASEATVEAVVMVVAVVTVVASDMVAADAAAQPTTETWSQDAAAYSQLTWFTRTCITLTTSTIRSSVTTSTSAGFGSQAAALSLAAPRLAADYSRSIALYI